MTYEYLKNLKKYNQTLKLLNSDNFAMMVAFFYFVFVEKRHISISHEKILSYLDDFLYDINRTYANTFPKPPKEYLNDFVSDKNGYLKKYHSSDGELLYELTPYTQKALEFLESLQKREFVGSRTKFNVILELLEELIFETNLTDEERIAKLKEQKAQIDKKIEAITKNQDLRFDSSRIKESFMLIEEQARGLLFDFSQIEYNFRELNLLAMEQIALKMNESKDSVLDSIFDIESSIRDSDQGKSFFAFWQILTDTQKSEQFSQMLETLYSLKEIQAFDSDKRLKNLKYDLLTNANKISKVTARLMEQLRRFLDDRAWVENRKILELCKSIEKSAIELKEDIPNQRAFMSIDNAKVKIDSVFEKSLYQIKKDVEFKTEIKEEEQDVDLESFYNLFFIDEAKLQNNINYFLQIKPQVSLLEVVEKFPVTKGVAELVSYLSIAKKDDNSIIYLDKLEKITISDENGVKKRVRIPKIIYLGLKAKNE